MNIIEFNKKNIVNYLNKKNIKIDNLDDYFNKMKIEIGEKQNSPYACIDQKDSYKMIISEDIPEEERYKWLNHEMIHVISNNQPFDGTINWTDVRNALTDINYDGELTSEVRYTVDELSDSTNINKTYDLIQKIHQG